MQSNIDKPLFSPTKEHLDTLMTGRRSLYPRQFSGEKIDDKIISQLLEYANTAPSHKLTRPWRFIVFSGKSMHELLDFKREYYISNTPESEVSEKKIASFDLKKEKTSHIIAIVMHRDELERIPEFEELAAVSCAVQNIYLSLKTFDLGGYWSTGKVSFSEETRNFLDIEGKHKVLGFFYLGKVNMELPVPERDSVEQRVIWKK